MPRTPLACISSIPLFFTSLSVLINSTSLTLLSLYSLLSLSASCISAHHKIFLPMSWSRASSLVRTLPRLIIPQIWANFSGIGVLRIRTLVCISWISLAWIYANSSLVSQGFLPMMTKYIVCVI